MKEHKIPLIVLEKYGNANNLSNQGETPITSKKDGRNIAIVATNAPRIPCIRYPTNVAVITIGPGEN